MMFQRPVQAIVRDVFESLMGEEDGNQRIQSFLEVLVAATVPDGAMKFQIESRGVNFRAGFPVLHFLHQFQQLRFAGRGEARAA